MNSANEQEKTRAAQYQFGHRMISRQRLVILAVSLLAALALFFALRGAPVPVEIADVHAGTFTESFEEQGKTELNHRYLVAAPIAGTLRRISLQQGDAVHADDVVAEVEPLRSALLDPATRARTAADAEGAGADVNAASERARGLAAADTLAQSDLHRMEGMSHNGAVSAADLDTARSRATQAHAGLLAAQADRHSAEQRRDALAAVLAQQGKAGGTPIPLHAPIDGVVEHRYKESAVPVTAGEALLEFGDPHDINIEVDTLSQDAVKLAPAMAARIMRWGGDAPLDARVTRIEPGAFTKISALGVEEQRTRVRLDFVSPYERWSRLGDGYRVEVEFVLWQGENVLQVPGGALFRDNGKWYAYRVDDGRAHKVEVAIGRRAATAIEIRSGLKSGDKVVAHPDDRIADGVRVAAP